MSKKCLAHQEHDTIMLTQDQSAICQVWFYLLNGLTNCCYFRGFLCTGISLTWLAMIK